MEKKLLKSSPIFFSAANSQFDRDSGFIRDCVMCQVGEAKGHGVNIDSEFLEALVSQVNQFGEKGIKARSGHPTMSDQAFGSLVGTFSNAKLVGTKAVADFKVLHASEHSPKGNLKKYIFGMANEAPEHFGLSIVFKRGKLFQRNSKDEKVSQYVNGKDPNGDPILVRNKAWQKGDKIFVELKTLHFCDFVSEGAATDGLFAAMLNSEQPAVKLSNFLDENPDIWKIVDDNPDKFQEFFKRYKTFKEGPSTLLGDALLDVAKLFSQKDKTETETEMDINKELPKFSAIVGAEKALAVVTELGEERAREIETALSNQQGEEESLADSNTKLLQELADVKAKVEALEKKPLGDKTETTKEKDETSTEEDYYSSDAYKNSSIHKKLKEFELE